ncbi:hypothetical protein V2G26_007427 [Clonostachys chloroleuca]
MTTSWPQEAAWPTNLREHAAQAIELPDFRTVHDALSLARTEATASAATTNESLNRIDAGIKRITGVIQQSIGKQDRDRHSSGAEERGAGWAGGDAVDLRCDSG